MRLMNHTLSPKLVGLLAGASLLTIGLTSPAMAQRASTLADPVQDSSFTLNGPRDPFSGDSAEGAQGAMELFHRLNLSNGRTMEQYRQQQQNNINSAVSDFHRRRQEALQQQNQQNSTPAEEAVDGTP